MGQIEEIWQRVNKGGHHPFHIRKEIKMIQRQILIFLFLILITKAAPLRAFFRLFRTFLCNLTAVISRLWAYLAYLALA